ncbi:D-glycerate dehydrogenase [candidate division WOR-3 bacterium]|nr:D-glycerate dehydrogenase [candidate division WOR-3 bacterium]
MTKVYVTRVLPGYSLKRLKDECKELVVNQAKRSPTATELLNGIKGKDGIISLLTDSITKEVIDASPQLRIIANCATGYDNIDIKYATYKGIMITNTPDVLTCSTAELTWAIILAVARRIPEADRYTRAGKFKGWAPDLLLGTELYNKTLGIIGAGKIGTEVGLKSKGFGMKIVYTDIKKNQILEQTLNAKKLSLTKLVKISDFITIHLPLNSKTYHLLSCKEFNLTKPSAFLINTSRGKVIDESALVEALRLGKIKGAGLDVYENEPKISDVLKKLDNVVLLPHIGSATQSARIKMADLAVENLLAGLKGKIPPNLVNKEVLKNKTPVAEGFSLRKKRCNS